MLGLSHSGAVRLVDRLAAAGLVRRTPGPDRREVAVVLTATGRRAAVEVIRARSDVVDSAIASLTVEERESLDHAAGRILAGLVRGPGARRWICRFCDLDACERARGRCPVETEARRRYGSMATSRAREAT